MGSVDCVIAGFKIRISYINKEVKSFLFGYFSDFDSPDLIITNTQDEIDYEKSISQEGRYIYNYEMMLIQRKIGDWIPQHSAFVFHGASFDVDGCGVVFAAHSGTGKTTHMALWKKLLGDRMTYVNGDKPIVRFFDDKPEVPYICGNPWNGKESYGNKICTPLKHLCFIVRAENNSVMRLNKHDVVERLLNQIYMPKTLDGISNTLCLADKLLSCCSVWQISCNMMDDAASVAYNGIFAGGE